MHPVPEGREGPEGLLTSEGSPVPPGSAPDAARGSPPAVSRAPLSGRTILVTRPAGQGRSLACRLEAVGATPVLLPTIRIADPRDRGPLLEAAYRVETYDWIVLTSVNGVRRLLAALAERGLGGAALAGRRVAAIGPATAAALHAAGATGVTVPRAYRAEALVEAILAAEAPAGVDRPGDADPAPRGPGPSGVSAGALEGRRILVPRAAEARAVLIERLRAAGARVDVVAAYETRIEHAAAARLERLLSERALDWVTFTSSSTVRAFVDLVGARTGGARVAAIGPITAATAADLAIPADAVAREYTTRGLVEAIVEAERSAPGRGRRSRTPGASATRSGETRAGGDG